MAAKQTRSRIIDAAIHIVRNNAPTKLTLDEAARQAGVSKGGVLYHFTSKDDLIREMIERLVSEQETKVAGLYEEEPEGPYRWLRTYVKYFFQPNGPGSDPAGAAFLAAMALNPDLLAPVRSMLKTGTVRMLSDSPDPDLAMLVGLCLDGFYLNEAIGIRGYDENSVAKLRATALELLSSDGPADKRGNHE